MKIKLIPTKRQFQNWSLPTKTGYVLAPLAIFLAISFFIFQYFWNISSDKSFESINEKLDIVITDKSNVNKNEHFTEPTFIEKIDTIKIQFGKANYSTYSQKYFDLYPRDKYGLEPFMHSGFIPLSVHIRERKMYIDFKWWSQNGNSPVIMNKNEFTINKSNWDRNYNQKAFEVVDNDTIPILQLIFVSSGHLRFYGLYDSPDGWGLVDDDGWSMTRVRPVNYKLKKLFKYPSWKYPGQFN